MNTTMTERLKEAGWGELPPPTSKYHFLGGDALYKLLKDYKFKTVLDIGSGMGYASRVFKEHGKEVVSVDFDQVTTYRPDYNSDYLVTHFDQKFDCIWCSHVLEHIVHHHLFLCKIFSELKDSGTLCITVPPAHYKIVEGHISVWNTGLLLYNLVLAGFDCREVSVKMYDYNISIIVTKKAAKKPVDNAVKYMPIHWNADGRIKELNW